MMNKTIILCLGSFVVGATASFLITRGLLKQKYATFAEEEIASVKEAFARAKERRKPILKEKEDISKVAKEKKKEETGKDPNGVLARSSIKENTYQKTKKDYHLVGKPEVEETPDDPDTSDEDEEEDEEERDAAGKTEQEMKEAFVVDRTLPYIITDQEFSDENPHYDKVSLYFYKHDEVVCEENEEPIDDVENVIGYEALNILDKQMGVWVRNERLAIDYEIIGINASYAEMVHGIHIKPIEPGRNLTPRERYIAKQQKRREENGGE